MISTPGLSCGKILVLVVKTVACRESDQLEGKRILDISNPEGVYIANTVHIYFGASLPRRSALQDADEKQTEANRNLTSQEVVFALQSL